MCLSEFILLFDFNRAGEETGENNIIRLYNSDYQQRDLIDCFETFQRFYNYEGDYKIASIFVSDKHVLDIILKGYKG